MARARNIKPGFFKNEILGELPFEFRLLFIGLWTYADREGRFEYRPRRIKADLMPYDNVNIEDGVAALVQRGFMYAYLANETVYCQINNWAKHQSPHHKEIASDIPPPPGHIDTVCADYIPLSNTIRNRIYERDGRKCKLCGTTHGLSIDHIVPISRGGNSTDDNLQVLCLGCNVRKGNRLWGDVQRAFMHESSMDHAASNQNALCPTDSGFSDSGFSDSLIPDSVESPELAEPASEPKAASRPAECDGAIPVMQFPVVGKGPTEWTLTKEKLNEYRGSFPGIDCLAECRKARQWCLDNPKKRKTAAGMTAFLGGWLSREQNRAARLHPSQSNGENKKPHRIQLSGK